MGDDGADGAWHWRRDSRPGAPGTLLELYRDVPATEAYDLLEEDSAQVLHTWLANLYRDINAAISDQDRGLDEDAPTGSPDGPPDEPEPDDPPPPSTGQAIGLLEHLLGAEVISEDEPPQDPR